MKYFIYFIFLAIFSVILYGIGSAFAAKTQQAHSEYLVPGDIKDEFQNVYQSFQPKLAVFNSTPLATDLDPGDMIISSPSVTVRNLIVKIGTMTYIVPLTLLP